MKIYLAGPIPALSYKESVDWRVQASEALKSRSDGKIRALSPFAGGFDLEAAEAIVRVGGRGSDVGNQSVISRPRTPESRQWPNGGRTGRRTVEYRPCEVFLSSR